ncbi:MAG TPA: hypothetical protein VM557_09620 [Thermoanaerobaculia bacterium]|nr:hypothetical protein [Thermoanaerobaculia bacterium]
MKHFAETDFIEALSLDIVQPDLAGHLEECASCRSRFEAVERWQQSRREETARAIDGRSESDWAAQRKEIASRTFDSRNRFAAGRFLAPAAAALLIAVLGGTFWLDRASLEVAHPGPARLAATTAESEAAVALPSSDPWAADSLAGWQEAVDWETWLEETESGGAS